MTSPAFERLIEVLSGFDRAAVAVSGGVDSLTLAAAAAMVLGPRAVMHHAVSPAVPPEATERVRTMARARGWNLRIFDAGEFADPAYRANPVNRCFFCKINLYGAIAARATDSILSGTNLDDLGEYRPGLEAAARHGVRHPFVEARIAKREVRELATQLGLGVVADLPAAPCLSSRVETGIGIEPPMLAAVHQVERMVATMMQVRTVRCRVRATSIVVELDRAALDALDPPTEAALRSGISALFRPAGISRAVAFAPYRNGSAFVHPAAASGVGAK